ncbi:hypothetical protein GC722_04220 [Auraticoccus sp. F435]|uniref:Winged helix DNA-binding domain-containing protein n=1 Tax=Auraticoccus cholistanensis TaxID=2656650 RepID=A0A6A9UVK1_9ACTN|nr:winged helix DNA-binding domain-containing protein [Auraticoccus cholistanensis]MVA75237.1 hypothetical protein [Auraticoccus cholistanensis]
MVTDHDIARWRLHTQGLTAPHTPDAAAVVDRLLAVQAENPSQSEWAVACRTASPHPADLARLLEQGRVVRTHVLRPTWHYVGCQDVSWLLELTAPRIRPVVLRQLQDHGLTGEQLDRLSTGVLEVLAAAPDRTRGELADELAGRGVEVAAPVLVLLVDLLELDRLICSGRPRDGSHTYALFATRVPPAPARDREEALAELALRYLAGHGPATERDLAYWASLTLTDARRGLAAVRGQLAGFDHDGRTYWHLAGAEPPAGHPDPGGHLLQILDEMYRGYQDSRMVLDAEGVVPRGRESAVGMALVDGQLVARMRRTLGRRVTFTLEPYRGGLTPDERTALEAAAARYGAFLGLDHAVEVV